MSDKVIHTMEVVAGGLLVGAGIIGLLSDREIPKLEETPTQQPSIPLDEDDD